MLIDANSLNNRNLNTCDAVAPSAIRLMAEQNLVENLMHPSRQPCLVPGTRFFYPQYLNDEFLKPTKKHEQLDAEQASKVRLICTNEERFHTALARLSERAEENKKQRRQGRVDPEISFAYKSIVSLTEGYFSSLLESYLFQAERITSDANYNDVTHRAVIADSAWNHFLVKQLCLNAPPSARIFSTCSSGQSHSFVSINTSKSYGASASLCSVLLFTDILHRAEHSPHRSIGLMKRLMGHYRNMAHLWQGALAMLSSQDFVQDHLHKPVSWGYFIDVVRFYEGREAALGKRGEIMPGRWQAVQQLHDFSSGVHDPRIAPASRLHQLYAIRAYQMKLQRREEREDRRQLFEPDGDFKSGFRTHPKSPILKLQAMEQSCQANSVAHATNFCFGEPMLPENWLFDKKEISLAQDFENMSFGEYP